MIIKKGNAAQAILIMSLVAILFIGMYFTMKPFALIYDKFTNDNDYDAFLTETDCDDRGGYWYDSSCHEISEKALSTIKYVRTAWLTAPFIAAFGLIFLLFIKSTRKDPYEFVR